MGAAAVERRFHTFEKSEEAHMLGKELHELDQAIKENLKISDVPEDWKAQQNLLKIEITNSDDIEDEWNDVEETWDDIKALDKKFYASPMGKKLKSEVKDVFESLDGAIYHNKKGIHIDNSKMDEVEGEINDVEKVFKKLEKTHWKKDYDAAFEAVFSNKQFASVGRRAKAFKHSKQGKALKSELHDFKMALKENVHVSDVPDSWKKDMFLF